MSTQSGKDYTSFRNVNLRGEPGVSGSIRTERDGEAGVASVPIKTGILPIMGTFRVQLPATSTSNTLYSTIVTVSGIRTEDALAVYANKGVSAGYSFTNSGGTARTLVAAEAGNGQITLTFLNIGTTGYVDQIYSYLAAR
jgi:hypothetical protein